MRTSTNYDVVKKLVGEITPTGETNTDEKRFENLKEMTELVEKLLTDITVIAHRYKESYEYSVMRAGEYAEKFIRSIELI